MKWRKQMKPRTKQQAKKTKEDVKPWVAKFGRFGIMTRGAVYILVGIVTLMAALGIGGSTKGAQGAFSSVASVPFGEVLLWVIGVGLICYIIWRILEFFTDPENQGEDVKGWLSRTGYIISGLIHIGFASKAFMIANHAGKSGDAKEKWTAKVLSEPFGQWMIGLLGVIIIGVGIHELYVAYTEKFVKRFNIAKMNPKEIRIGKLTGKIGISARGIVICIIGYFLIITAITLDTDKAMGIDEAIGKLASEPYGQWMLVAVAIGLFLYGIFEVIKGKNQHMGLKDF
ncbi:DUF1206 domain-containing protein [Priestia koreensis]|uniref:DUF1206 domain-containing protein n=2 Tax=Priestia koreensis TaxID=284581 RepID=UPI0028F6D3E6|nr:DUF1206 domain-containing protein [Priestia koreensis]